VPDGWRVGLVFFFFFFFFSPKVAIGELFLPLHSLAALALDIVLVS